MTSDYESEFEKIKGENKTNRESIIEKYRNTKILTGLDGSPMFDELGQESKRFCCEWNRLKQKYNKK